MLTGGAAESAASSGEGVESFDIDRFATRVGLLMRVIAVFGPAHDCDPLRGAMQAHGRAVSGGISWRVDSRCREPPATCNVAADLLRWRLCLLPIRDV